MKKRICLLLTLLLLLVCACAQAGMRTFTKQKLQNNYKPADGSVTLEVPDAANEGGTIQVRFSSLNENKMLQMLEPVADDFSGEPDWQMYVFEGGYEPSSTWLYWVNANDDVFYVEAEGRNALRCVYYEPGYEQAQYQMWHQNGALSSATREEGDSARSVDVKKLNETFSPAPMDVTGSGVNDFYVMHQGASRSAAAQSTAAPRLTASPTAAPSAGYIAERETSFNQHLLQNKFTPATEPVIFKVRNPVGNRREVKMRFSHLMENQLLKTLMPCSAAEADWTLYVPTDQLYTDRLYWQSQNGDILYVSRKGDYALQSVYYQPRGDGSTYRFLHMNGGLSEVSREYNGASTTLDLQTVTSVFSPVVLENTSDVVDLSFIRWDPSTEESPLKVKPGVTATPRPTAAPTAEPVMPAAPAVTAMDGMIEFTPPIVVADTADVKIELIDFHQESINWGNGEVNESVVAFKIYNKTEQQILIHLTAYLGMDEANAIMLHGNAVAAGKAAVRSYYIQQYKGSRVAALDSLEQLYQMDGNFNLTINEPGQPTRFENIGFAFQDLLSAPDQAAPADQAQPAVVPTAAPTPTPAQPAHSMRVRTVQLAQDYPVLKTGSKGEAAKKLQQALIDQGFLNSKADGAYGKVTAAAVAEFQKSVGLETTGVADAATQSALYGEKSEVQLTLTGISETEKIRIEALVANEAYEQEHPGYVQLALCYTLFAPENTFHTNGTKTTISFEQGNSYISEHAPKSCLYMGSYYYGTYSQEVVYGSEFKIVETFSVPRAELKAGRKITITNKLIPETLSLMSDDVLMCRDMEYAARIVDPEGYANQAYRLTEADSATQSKVRKHLNGYYWDFWISNQGSYRIEFASKTYKLRGTVFGLSNTTNGTYTIANGYIIIKNSHTDTINYIPYTLENGSFKLDPVAGMSVHEN